MWAGVMVKLTQALQTDGQGASQFRILEFKDEFKIICLKVHVEDSDFSVF